MEPPLRTSRRTLLLAGSAGLGAAALAACGGSAVRVVEGSGRGTVLVGLADLPVGGTAEMEAGGRRLLVTRPAEDTVLGFAAECPHQGCNVRAGTGGALACPCHASTFDPATGDRLSGPADSGLTPVAVAVSGEDVVLA